MRTLFTHTRAWRIILILIVITVSYLAVSPAPPRGVDFGWDKLNHIGAFVALAFSAWLGLSASPRRQRLWLLVLMAYGGAIEVIQLYVPGRSCEWGDLAADAVGITVGALLGAMALEVSNRPNSPPIR